MNANRALWLVLPLAASALLACDNNGSSGGSPPATASAVASAAPPVASASAAASVTPAASGSASAPASMRHHVGIAGVLMNGAYEFSLTDAQKATLDKLEDALYADDASSPWTAAKSFQADLVAGMRAGKLDNAKLTADYAAIDKAVLAGQAREADALNGLHGLLDAGQRAQLTAAVRAKREGHDRPPMGATDAGADEWTKRRLDRLTSELGLDAGQQKSVAAILAKDPMTPATMQAKRDAMQKKVDTMLTEFEKDPFDAKKLDLVFPPGKTPHEAMDRTVTFTAQLLPILKPEQRETLAARTEKMANRPGRYLSEDTYGPPFGGGGQEDSKGAGPPR
ncbi:MAG TPA: hypothetical protein VIF09_03870 [Polyangiaceae bacterium]|jgi:hypothetical protein